MDHDQSDFCQVRPVLADVSMKSPPRPQSPATRPASSGQEADPQLICAERPDLRALLLDLLRASVEHNGGYARGFGPRPVTYCEAPRGCRAESRRGIPTPRLRPWPAAGSTARPALAEPAEDPGSHPQADQRHSRSTIWRLGARFLPTGLLGSNSLGTRRPPGPGYLGAGGAGRGGAGCPRCISDIRRRGAIASPVQARFLR